jgi:hypothetical protein
MRAILLLLASAIIIAGCNPGSTATTQNSTTAFPTPYASTSSFNTVILTSDGNGIFENNYAQGYIIRHVALAWLWYIKSQIEKILQITMITLQSILEKPLLS